MRTMMGMLIALGAVGCAGNGSVGEEEEGAAIRAVSAVHAQLSFDVGWLQQQRGAIVRGGHVEVTYNRARMAATGCADATVFANALFRPGGERFSSHEAFGFDVPTGAESVELWFHALSP